MKKFSIHEGLVAPLDRSNVDTDAILPKQFLKSIKRTGFGVNLFDEWRYLDRDDAGLAISDRRPNPDFVLNRAEYQGATILLTKKNFGCGSSREHAPWALDQYGFRVVIAPSFGDIFYENCFKNGLLPIVLSEQLVDDMFRLIASVPGLRLLIDLTQQTIETPNASLRHTFHIDPSRKHCLLNGLDEIGLTILQAEQISQFEARRLAGNPWLARMIE